ncbi:MAG: ABC transporter ATP-binding protein [Solobacterium sp.]|nr:ABC transporter ATP-binding protein [Solobacterium sp.]
MEEKTFKSRSALVLYFLRGAKRWFALAVVFAGLVSLMEMVNPKIIGFTVDSVLSDKPSKLPAFVNRLIEGVGGTVYLREHLYVIAAAVIVFALLSASCRYLFRLCNTKGAERLVKTMRDDLFGHILKLPFSWHAENHTGDIIQRCTSDVEQIKMFLSEQLTSLFRISVLLIMAVTFMFRINTSLAFGALAFIPVIMGYSYFFHHRIGSAFQKVDEEEGRLSSIAQENLTGVRVVRAFGRESYERSRFEKQNASYTGLWIHLMNLMAAFWCSGDLISYLQILVVITYGSYLCVNGTITAGSFIEFISYNNLLLWPVRWLGRVVSNLSKAGISIDRLMYIMNAAEEKDLPDAVEPDMAQDITFDHVSYTYDNGKTGVLNDISFTIPAHSTFGILGSTGSGKSTLMYLLDRLYETDQGTVKIGDTDVRKIKASWLRSHIGMVLQEPYLFSRKLSENIAIAVPSAHMDDIRAAARTAALEEAVDRFKEGYDTYVGERGVTLSGGQKQRTAIAQMLIRKPDIMIFDDSLSAVDAETDAKIRSALKENIGSSTVILISHRITTLMNCDRIVVMDKGRVMEEGSHQELLAKNGIYRRIYDLQSRQAEEVSA